jgi:hypothetical protein
MRAFLFVQHEDNGLRAATKTDTVQLLTHKQLP